jgi:hypothetical protein
MSPQSRNVVVPLTSDGTYSNQNKSLLEHLWELYSQHLRAVRLERKGQGRAVVSQGEALRIAPATAFISWAQAYLRENPPAESWYHEGNLGMRLTDGAAVTISQQDSPEVSTGEVLDAGAVAITDPRTPDRPVSRRRNAGSREQER